MATSFMGKEGFIWWHGVVENRKDPLFIGRCKVRILGWHTHDKEDMPTETLPWAYPLMPLTSASQTEVGYSPTGPVEGTWILGFFRDGLAGQEPVMLGTMGGIPEGRTLQETQNVGFNDPRRDIGSDLVDDSDEEGNRVSPDEGTLEGSPYKPKSLLLEPGKPVQIEKYEDSEKVTYPRFGGKPTTSKYARGMSDNTSRVIHHNTDGAEIPGDLKSESIIADKKSKSITHFSPIDTAGLFSKSFSEPESPYRAEYPYNHVYESESGHLIEIDDTPDHERLHWYHRSGTFTEIHPTGTRVDRVHDDKYDMIWRNHRMKVGGSSFTNIGTNYERKSGGPSTVWAGGSSSFTVASGKYEHRLMNGSYLLTAKISDTAPGVPGGPGFSKLQILKREISPGDITIAANDTLRLKGYDVQFEIGHKQTRTMGGLDESVRGNASYFASTLGLGSSGEMTIAPGGNLAINVTGGIQETILLAPPHAPLVAKKTETKLGKLVMECFDGVATGGIDLNMGPHGGVSSITMMPGAKGGHIDIASISTPGSRISLAANKMLDLVSYVDAFLEAKKVQVIADIEIALKAGRVNIADATSPAVLGDKLAELYKEHKHSTANGLSGPPDNRAKISKIKSKQVKLS